MKSRFSTRQGFASPDPETTITREAPHELRGIVVTIAYESGMNPWLMRTVIGRVLRVRLDPDNRPAFPELDGVVRGALDGLEWYEVYDVIEAIHDELLRESERSANYSDPADEPRPVHFVDAINDYFRRRGIGWGRR